MSHARVQQLITNALCEEFNWWHDGSSISYASNDICNHPDAKRDEYRAIVWEARVSNSGSWIALVAGVDDPQYYEVTACRWQIPENFTKVEAGVLAARIHASLLDHKP